MQPQGHAQVVIRMADYRQNPQAAIDAPRWRVDDGLKVNIEPGFAPEVYEALRARGHEITVAAARTVAHGGAQAIYKLDDGYFGASDSRRDGQAVGF
jgi:gamma-glutamyltranspeptidase / glutathione hydrolase